MQRSDVVFSGKMSLVIAFIIQFVKISIITFLFIMLFTKENSDVCNTLDDKTNFLECFK